VAWAEEPLARRDDGERVRAEPGGHAAELAAKEEIDAQRVGRRARNQRIDVGVGGTKVEQVRPDPAVGPPPV
jgi:hypothetical protein